MNKIVKYYFSDCQMCKLLLGGGFGMSLYALLFPTIGTTAIVVSIIGAAIFQPNANGKLMKSVFGNESKGGLNNIWILTIYLLVFLTVIILAYILEIYENNKDYYYMWIGISSLIYFFSVFYLFLRFLSRRNKQGDS